MPYYPAPVIPQVTHPGLNNSLWWNADPFHAVNAGTVTAGTVYWARGYSWNTITYANAWVFPVAGNATSAVNGWMGVYGGNPGDARKSVNAVDASAAMTTGGTPAKVAQTADGGQTLTIPAGTFFYVALLLGTQSTTPATWTRDVSQTNGAGNFNLVAGTNTLRFFTGATGQTVLPTTVTALGSQANANSSQFVLALT